MLDSPADLTEFKAKLRVPRRLPPATIRLGPTITPAPQRAAAQERLRALYSDCGCTAGSFAAGAAAVASAIRLTTSQRPAGLSDGLQCAGAVVAAALIGKVLGLAYKRAALLRFVTRFESSLTTPDANG